MKQIYETNLFKNINWNYLCFMDNLFYTNFIKIKDLYLWVLQFIGHILEI